MLFKSIILTWKLKLNITWALEVTAGQNQGQSKGPDPASSGEPPRMFGGPMNDEERKEVLTKLYGQVKTSLQKLVKPDGEKTSPARTCSELFATYPEKLTGK